jgi:hypothetical protein
MVGGASGRIRMKQTASQRSPLLPPRSLPILRAAKSGAQAEPVELMAGAKGDVATGCTELPRRDGLVRNSLGIDGGRFAGWDRLRKCNPGLNFRFCRSSPTTIQKPSRLPFSAAWSRGFAASEG